MIAVERLTDELARLLPDYLPRQRWYGGPVPIDGVEIIELDVLRADEPMLVWALVKASGDELVYQLLVGLRPLQQTERFLEGKGRVFLGDVEGADQPLLAYDALVDPELALTVLSIVAPDESADAARPMNVEQSNTSVVYDERLILKIFRRVHFGPNPDAEVIDALAEVEFCCVPKSIATWRRDGRDLAVVREYLGAGADGWQLAMTSLRDLYDLGVAPEEAGGDFAPESERLGHVTAELHLALADAFGTEPGDVVAWAATLAALPRDEAIDADDLARAYERLRDVEDPGVAIRIHGDYHLGQVLRTDAGWIVLDFEGEPRVPMEERRAHSSPLRDVAGMLRSFHYAAQAALLERHEPPDEEFLALADRWEQRNAEAFERGYFGTDGIDRLLPADLGDRRIVVATFELAKAVYEVGYERAHRPDWLTIPLTAVERILGGTVKS